MPHLVLQRAVAPAFEVEADYQAYLARLAEDARRLAVQVHGYALLPRAVWLLLTPQSCAGLSTLMQQLARCTSRARATGRAAPALWDGRFRCAVLQPERWMLPALCGVDRAAEFDADLSAADWRWSSRAHHLGQHPAPWLREAQAYWALGNTPYAREAAFAEALGSELAARHWPALSAAVRAGAALGDEGFVAMVEQELGRPARPGRRGRPRLSVPN